MTSLIGDSPNVQHPSNPCGNQAVEGGWIKQSSVVLLRCQSQTSIVAVVIITQQTGSQVEYSWAWGGGSRNRRHLTVSPVLTDSEHCV